jgi:probable rRNA maturation factor
MTVDVSEPPEPRVDPRAIASFAEATLRREGVDADAKLTVTFIDVDTMADFNERYMGRQGPTDVLSFPIEDAAPGAPPTRQPGGPPLELGDIFISVDVVADHADEYGVSFDDELYLMVCHGVLHILGWDHQTEAEAEAMEAREAEHLGTIGRSRR